MDINSTGLQHVCPHGIWHGEGCAPCAICHPPTANQYPNGMPVCPYGFPPPDTRFHITDTGTGQRIEEVQSPPASGELDQISTNHQLSNSVASATLPAHVQRQFEAMQKRIDELERGSAEAFAKWVSDRLVAIDGKHDPRIRWRADDGRIHTYDMPGCVRHWLASLPSAPPPSWTATPPTEPGVYWWRYKGLNFPGEAVRLPEAAKRFANAPVEWYPVPIKEPQR
jgi:hypothetical protein